MDVLGECGEVGPGPLLELAEVAEAGPVVEEARRLRLSPEEGARPPCVGSSSSSPSSSFMPGAAAPLMERPPGRLLGPETGPGMLMGPEERPMGAPTGMEEGREPWGALRHAWIRFLPSGCVTRGCSFAVVKV
jgi:hypothetical protein